MIIALAAGSVGAQRVWKTGRVLDSKTSNESYVASAATNESSRGIVVDTGGVAVGNETSTCNTTVNRITIRTDELAIVGEDYFYIIEDTTRKSSDILWSAIANRHHGCHFIVGAEVKYAQDKATLHVIDADGKECKAVILRQETRQPFNTQGAAQPSEPQPQVMRAANTTDISPAGLPSILVNAETATHPRVHRKVEPEYSEEALLAGFQRTVVVYIEVDATGHPQNIRVLRGLGHGLDEKAIEAVAQWEFLPAEKGGEPVTMPATVEVNFRYAGLPPSDYDRGQRFYNGDGVEQDSERL